MFEEETLDRIAEETNHHTQQLIASKAHPKRYETNPTEMCAFLGIALNILFGNKQVPKIHSYWSKNPLLGVPKVHKILPENRRAKISQYLHLTTREENCQIAMPTTQAPQRATSS